MANAPKSALIVGASRGLGLGLVETFLQRGWSVTATQRSPSKGLSVITSGALTVETADIDDDASIAALQDRLSGRHFDLVFVVAGVATQAHDPLHEVPREVAAQVYLTNAVSPVRFAETFHDSLAPGGLLAFMSSVLGSVALNESGGWENYRASKAALNTLVRSFALRHAEDGFGTVLMHPHRDGRAGGRSRHRHQRHRHGGCDRGPARPGWLRLSRLYRRDSAVVARRAMHRPGAMVGCSDREVAWCPSPSPLDGVASSCATSAPILSTPPPFRSRDHLFASPRRSGKRAASSSFRTTDRITGMGKVRDCVSSCHVPRRGLPRLGLGTFPSPLVPIEPSPRMYGRVAPRSSASHMDASIESSPGKAIGASF